jgi:hypothetical protein
MNVRQEPFSVHLRFTSPSAQMGQEVCYVAGRHGGKLRVRGSGLKSALGFITLSLDHPRVRAQSRHTVAEAGIGNLIELIAALASERESDSSTEITAYHIDGRACTRVQLVLPDRPGRYAWRVRIYFDDETRLPVRFEAFDSPTPGEPEGPLLERYTYSQLALNAGIAETTFNK